MERVTLPAVNGHVSFDGGETWVWRCGWDGVDLTFEAGYSAVPTSAIALEALEEELQGRYPFDICVQGPNSDTATVSLGTSSVQLPQHEQETVGSVGDVHVRIPTPHRHMTLVVTMLGMRVCEVEPFADLELAE